MVAVTPVQISAAVLLRGLVLRIEVGGVYARVHARPDMVDWIRAEVVPGGGEEILLQDATVCVAGPATEVRLGDYLIGRTADADVAAMLVRAERRAREAEAES